MTPVLRYRGSMPDQRRLQATRLKCTRLKSVAALRRLRHCLDSLVLLQARTARYHPVLLYPRLSTRMTPKYHSQRNIHIAPRQFTRTKPTRMMQTRLASRSMRYSKYRTSVDDGGKQERRTEMLVSRRQITLSCCNTAPFVFDCIIPFYHPHSLR